MFQTIWGPVLAALTMSFETTDETKTVEKCLLGFELSLHIALHCYVEEALQTLVDSFAKFTRLSTAKAIKDVKPKNIMYTNALIKCATEDHMYLKGAWSNVLGELSALDIIQDSGDFELHSEMTKDIFILSAELDRESILDFVNALCQIDAAELEENPPRMFPSTKLLKSQTSTQTDRSTYGRRFGASSDHSSSKKADVLIADVQKVMN